MTLKFFIFVALGMGITSPSRAVVTTLNCAVRNPELPSLATTELSFVFDIQEGSVDIREEQKTDRSRNPAGISLLPQVKF